MASEAVESVIESEIFANVVSANPIEIIQYCAGEYIYSVQNRSDEELKEFFANEEVANSMASVVADKYITLSKLEYNEGKHSNKFAPPMSSLGIYASFMLNIISSFKGNNQESTLVADLLLKSLSIVKAIITLLTNGFETEAFSDWRTLHECECTLSLLNKYSSSLINVYIKHLNFGLAYKDMIPDVSKRDELFYQMKDEMKEFNLKSKDIKKYIEYGWLYSVPGVKEDPEFKLNFRDGLERVAGLASYSKRYEMSSEIIHSTPMLIYSNKTYFYYMTLLNTYESFFRLELIFAKLFAKYVNQDALKHYENMKNIYYSQLVNIHKREVKNFTNWQKSLKKDA